VDHPDRGDWPPWSFGLHDALPLEVAWTGLVASALGSLWFGLAGWRAFRRPTRAEALARLDATLPGQPDFGRCWMRRPWGGGSGLGCGLAGASGPHGRRRHGAGAGADLRLSRRDPFALRYVALTALVMALMFGSLWRVGSVAGMTAGPADAMQAGPSWEGWVQPPAFTGKPSLYLPDLHRRAARGANRQPRAGAALWRGRRADAGRNRVGAVEPRSARLGTRAGFRGAQSGQSRLPAQAGACGKLWRLPDKAPGHHPGRQVSGERDGKMKLPFAASDDYGVTAGRRHHAGPGGGGPPLRPDPDPEPREALLLDLPLPITGKRTEFSKPDRRSVEASLRQPAGDDRA
jgi:hypothetical protein